MWGKQTHTSLAVSNLEKALAFYRDLLGMKVLVSMLTPYPPDEPMDKIFNMKKVSFRVAQVGYDDSYLLELLEWVPQGPKPSLADRKPNELGFHWQCIYHTDVDGIYKKLKAAGVKFVSEPVKLAGGTVTSVFCLDPDGNWIEIHSPRK